MANPTVSSAISDRSDDEGDSVTIDVSGVFDDDDLAVSVTYSVSGLPSGTGLTIDSATGILSGNYTAADIAAAPITVTVTATPDTGSTVNVTKTLNAVTTGIEYPLVWLNGIGYNRDSEMPHDSAAMADEWSFADVATINWTPAQNAFSTREDDITDIVNTEFKTYLCQYVNVLRMHRSQARFTGTNDESVDIVAELDAGNIGGTASWTPADWWGRRNDGTLDSEPGFGENFVNYTDSAPIADSQGRLPWRRVAEYYLYEDLQLDQLDIDGVYFDNAQPVLPFSEQNTDFNRNGQGTISRFDAGAVTQRSRAVTNCANYFRQIKRNVLGDTDFFVLCNGGASFETATVQYEEYKQAAQGISFENFTGPSNTNQTGIAWDGSDSFPSKTWEAAYDRHLNNMNHITSFGPNGENFCSIICAVNPDNYQTARMGLCTALMSGAYIALATETSAPVLTATPTYGESLQIDEMVGGDLTGMTETQKRSNRHYLGEAVDAQQTSSWSSGVWKREFENGVALLNPKGNGAQTVSVTGITKSGFHLEYIDGGQDPVRNPGGDVGSTVSLAGGTGDGVVLLWTADP